MLYNKKKKNIKTTSIKGIRIKAKQINIETNITYTF